MDPCGDALAIIRAVDVHCCEMKIPLGPKKGATEAVQSGPMNSAIKKKKKYYISI